MDWRFWSPLFIGISMGLNIGGLLNVATNNTYKDGQIDALQGKVIYELKLQDDGSTKWVYKEND